MTDTHAAPSYHAPVLLSEVVAVLSGARRVLDGTLGGGGHALGLLEGGADVTGIDRDPAAIAAARARLARFEAEGRFRAFRGNYANLDQMPDLAGQRFGGILLDLGVSSHQFDDSERGFSFRRGAALDMRMDRGAQPAQDEPETAADVLNGCEEADLAQVFRDLGDEPKAGRLAHEIVRRRATRPFATSDDLVGAIRAVLGARSGPADFARLFQALRIAVNDELGGLGRALPALRDRLEPGGVFAVISYHSGEDRLVKHAFREWSAECVCPPLQLVCACRGRALGSLIQKKATSASAGEIAVNPRARSAHLRAWRIAPLVGD